MRAGRRGLGVVFFYSVGVLGTADICGKVVLDTIARVGSHMRVAMFQFTRFHSINLPLAAVIHQNAASILLVPGIGRTRGLRYNVGTNCRDVSRLFDARTTCGKCKQSAAKLMSELKALSGAISSMHKLCRPS